MTPEHYPQRLIPWLACVMASSLCLAQSTLTPGQLAELAQEQQAQQAQQAQTEEEARQLLQQYEQEQLALQQSKIEAAQAKAVEKGAQAQWGASTTLLALERGQQHFGDDNALMRYNATAQLKMIEKAALNYVATQRERGVAIFSETSLTNPFAANDEEGRYASHIQLPSCFTHDEQTGAITVGPGCGAHVCAGRLEDGDIPLSADGLPIDLPSSVNAFLALCQRKGAPLIVFRPRLADVVSIK